MNRVVKHDKDGKSSAKLWLAAAARSLLSNEKVREMHVDLESTRPKVDPRIHWLHVRTNRNLDGSSIKYGLHDALRKVLLSAWCVDMMFVDLGGPLELVMHMAFHKNLVLLVMRQLFSPRHRSSWASA